MGSFSHQPCRLSRLYQVISSIFSHCHLTSVSYPCCSSLCHDQGMPLPIPWLEKWWMWQKLAPLSVGERQSCVGERKLLDESSKNAEPTWFFICSVANSKTKQNMSSFLASSDFSFFRSWPRAHSEAHMNDTSACFSSHCKRGEGVGFKRFSGSPGRPELCTNLPLPGLIPSLVGSTPHLQAQLVNLCIQSYLLSPSKTTHKLHDWLLLHY